MSIADDPKAWKSVGEKQYLNVLTGDLVIGRDYDTLNVTYPTTTTEVYSYVLDSVAVVALRVTYSTAAKEILTTVEVM